MSLFSLHPSHLNGQMVCFDRCTKYNTNYYYCNFCECAIVFSMLSVAVGLCTCLQVLNFLSLHITSHTLYNKYKLLKIVFTLIVVSKSL